MLCAPCGCIDGDSLGLSGSEDIGSALGTVDGEFDGKIVGRGNGSTLSARMLSKNSWRLMAILGLTVGALDGAPDSTSLGAVLGAALGTMLGAEDGVRDGAALGLGMLGLNIRVATMS